MFLIFAKARQIRECLLGHMYTSGTSEAGGQENLSGAELRFGHTCSLFLGKEEGIWRPSWPPY